MEKLYADIIINISHEALDKVFAYKVPFSMIKDIWVGQQVVVPFGRSNKEQTGYVVNLSRTVDYDESKVKEILRIETDHVGVESNMIELAAWIRENYGSTMIQALKTVLPVQEKVARKARKYIELCIEKVHGPAMLDEYFSKHYVAKARLLAALLDHGKISWEMASKDLKISKSTVDSIFIVGNNFTNFCQVFDGDVKINTTYHNEHLLEVSKKDLKDGDTFKVSIVSKALRVLSSSNEYVYQ